MESSITALLFLVFFTTLSIAIAVGLAPSKMQLPIKEMIVKHCLYFCSITLIAAVMSLGVFSEAVLPHLSKMLYSGQ